jgi:hypothetical protein
MLIAMLICWAGQGHPIYAFIGRYQNPVYISDIGATNLQPLFISCAGAQGIIYSVTLLTEYRLRKCGKLQYWFKKDERNLIFAGCILGSIGQLGILLCACLNTRDFTRVHATMLGIFVGFVFLSMVTVMTQYCMMGLNYKKIHVHHKTLNKFMISFALKLLWTIIAVVLVGCFAGIDNDSVSGGFEWALAFWYTFLWLIFAWDLFPAAKKHHKNLPYIHGWSSKRFYMYDKNLGESKQDEKAPHQLNDVGDTLVDSSTDRNREFTDEELGRYPLSTDHEIYPIPDGQRVDVYDRIS